MKRVGGALALAALGLWAGCREASLDLPEGTWLVAEAGALQGVLGQLEGFVGSPAARLAGEARARLEGCRRAVSHPGSASPIELLEALECGDGKEVPAELEMRFGPASIVVSHASGGGELLARAVWRAGVLSVEIELLPGGSRGPLDMLLPAEEGPGPARIEDRELLLHGRFRSDRGLDIASWVTADSELDRLWGLRSRLLSSALLTGVWEVAVLSPGEGESLPPPVVVAEVRSAEAAERAVEEVVRRAETTWDLVRSPLSADPAAGGCFTELRILPDLGPCWAVRDGALWLGWNAGALEAVLARGSGPVADELDGVDSSLVVHLDRFPEAERRITRARFGRIPDSVQEAPWSRLLLRGHRTGEGYGLALRLDRRDDRIEAVEGEGVGRDGSEPAPPPAGPAR